VGWNVGKVGEQEVSHAYLHVLPRYADELYAGRGIRYWIKQPENSGGFTIDIFEGEFLYESDNILDKIYG